MLNITQETKAKYNCTKIPCSAHQMGEKSEKLVIRPVDWGVGKQGLKPKGGGNANLNHLNRKQVGSICLNWKSHTLWSAG